MIELKLPKLGESIVGATVVQWLKKEGDMIRLDEPLVEVSTDKVNSEIPSPVAGKLAKIIAQVDESIEVGAIIALLDVESAVTESAPVEEPKIQKVATDTSKEEFFSPAVMRIAQMEGLSLDAIRKIEGTGEGGRVTRRDVERYCEAKPACKQAKAAPVVTTGKEERVKLTAMRKAIADNMVRSFYEAPHASIVVEADVTEAISLINREKESFLATHGVKLTITTFLISALTKAIQQWPMLNASLEKEEIVLKRYVNVGIAVNIEQGLVVPVIKNCQDRNIVSIAKEVADLSSKARSSKLSPDDVTEGTVTLTNFGMTGAIIGVPIIRYPEVAIIGAGSVKKRVVVRDDDSFAIRHMVYLTLTFDHRVIDGIYGCNFLASFKDNLESISTH